MVSVLLVSPPCRPPHGGVDRNYAADRPPRLDRVAPLTGAWIETDETTAAAEFIATSPPSRGRGSKRSQPRCTRAPASRPPHGGVDRNTRTVSPRDRVIGRPPHGGVDRNSSGRQDTRRRLRSPPSRGRGSKRGEFVQSAITSHVAPLTGAWIETCTGMSRRIFRRCRPPHGGVDRNLAELRAGRDRRRRPPPHGGVDRNDCGYNACQSVAPSPPSRGRGSKPPAPVAAPADRRRPPHGGVDRNMMTAALYATTTGRPPHGGVDRNSL